VVVAASGPGPLAVNPRTTGILFLVAAAVVGGVWWYENVHKTEAAQAEAEARVLFPNVDAADVTFVALETTDGKAARIERRDGTFRLVKPLDFAVDDTTVNGIVGALTEVASEGVIESPQDPAVYGLGDGADTVRFGTAEGEHAIRLGAKTPVGSNTYAARDDDPTVYTIPTYRANALRRSLTDLREKRVLRFDRDSIDRIDLSWHGGGVTLEKGDQGWRVTAPLDDAADEDTVKGLLSDLTFLRAEGFRDDAPSDAAVGLDHPVFEAKLTGKGADGEKHVFDMLVGDEMAGNRRVVRGSDAALYEIASERLSDFPQKLAAYRFKKLADFVPSDARQLELAFHDPKEGAHVVIAEHGDDGWTSSPEQLAPGRAARMVAELSTLHGSDIVAESATPAELKKLGLDPPNVTLRVRGKAKGDELGPVLAEVQLGNVDHEKGIVARRADQERIYRIDYELAEHLPVSLEALRNRFVSKQKGDEAQPAPDEPEPSP
jgi:hypothetical protein